MIGKRKRETAVVSRPAQQTEDPLAIPPSSHDLFRAYFEAEFQPLEENSPKRRVPDANPSDNIESESDGDVSEWSGLSDSEDDDEALEVAPEVVDHSSSQTLTHDGTERELRKQFMSAKPPSVSQSRSKNAAAKPESTSGHDEQEEAASDAMNLKHDLALQRLLKESHLLDSAHDLNPMGKNRHRALDIRLQSIGASESIFTQKKMPMAHRKGIGAKAAKKEESRRREARENGIILEKQQGPKRKLSSGGGGGGGGGGGHGASSANNTSRRDRGVGGPSIGKFSGGTLKLSKRDLMDIQGPRLLGAAAGKKKKKGRR